MICDMPPPQSKPLGELINKKGKKRKRKGEESLSFCVRQAQCWDRHISANTRRGRKLLGSADMENIKYLKQDGEEER